MVRKYKKSKVKKPKGYAKAARNAIPLGNILSGKSVMGGFMGGLNPMGNLGKSMGGPGTHSVVKSSGKSIGTMADGKQIWLKGPNMGNLVK